MVATGFLAGSPGQFVRNVLDREGVRHQFVEIPGETRVNIFVERRLGSGPPTSFNEEGPEVASEGGSLSSVRFANWPQVRAGRRLGARFLRV